MNITAIELEQHLADLFALPNVRADIEGHFALKDYHAAALVLSRLVERRINRLSTTPALPAAVVDPHGQAGRGEGFTLESELSRLTNLAGMTP